MSIFSAGEKLAEMAFSYASKPITYKRNGIVVTTNIPAKIGKTQFRSDDISSGMSIRWEQCDFIICASALNIKPQNGDEIEFQDKVYLVSAPDGESCWKWHSRQSHTQIRIHAKFMGEK